MEARTAVTRTGSKGLWEAGACQQAGEAAPALPLDCMAVTNNTHLVRIYLS